MAEIDAKLLQELRAGHPQARERFLEIYHPRIFSFGMMVCGHREDAEDIAQESAMAALAAVGDLRSPQAFSVWLFRLVKHACSRQRRRARVGPKAAERLDDHAAALRDESRQARPESNLIRGQSLALVRQAMDRLAPQDRLILLLRDFEELSIAEVAAVMGLGQSAVKMRLQRVRQRLEKQLRPYFAAAAPPKTVAGKPPRQPGSGGRKSRSGGQS